MTTLYGMKVIQSEMVVTEVPNKVHKLKSWMEGRCYHDRIQKKWKKRYGVRNVQGMCQLADTIVLHPELYQQVLKELNDTINRRIEDSMLCVISDIKPRGFVQMSRKNGKTNLNRLMLEQKGLRHLYPY